MRKILFSLLASTLLTGSALAQGAPAPVGAPQNPPPPPARGPGLDLAIEAAKTALAEAKAGDQKVAVTVIDSAGVIKLVVVADGTGPRAVQNSNFKAQAALAFKEPSGQLAEEVKTNKELADKIAANPNYLARAGAVLLKVNGEVIGAIGVGGARGSDKDEAYAKAGLAKIEAQLQ
jgi:uncharacterized protein GlcG (DUF336 family)